MDAKKEQIEEGYQKLVELDYEIDARTYLAKDFLGDSYPLGGFTGILLERQGQGRMARSGYGSRNNTCRNFVKRLYW